MGFIRLFLACVVVSDHAVGLPRWVPIRGNEAVIIFFVISGYLIASLLTPRISGGRDNVYKAESFYKSRLLRLYPAYIAILLLAIFLDLASESQGKNSNTKFSNVLSVDNPKAVLLFFGTNLSMYGLNAPVIKELPSAVDWIYITPAWSLTPEIAFYGLSPFFFKFKNCRPFFWGLCVFTLPFHLLNIGNPIANFFPFHHFFFFGIGALAYIYRETLNALTEFRHSYSILILFVMFTLSMRNLNFAPHLFFCFSFFGIGVVVNKAFFGKRSKREMYAADLSYPLYLVHMPLMEFASKMFSIEPGNFGILETLAVFICSLFISSLVVRFIEKPFTKFRHDRFRKT